MFENIRSHNIRIYFHQYRRCLAELFRSFAATAVARMNMVVVEVVVVDQEAVQEVLLVLQNLMTQNLVILHHS
jgi:hypothetical protein